MAKQREVSQVRIANMVKMAAQRISRKMAEFRAKSRLPSAKTARFDGAKLQIRAIDSGNCGDAFAAQDLRHN